MPIEDLRKFIVLHGYVREMQRGMLPLLIAVTSSNDLLITGASLQVWVDDDLSKKFVQLDPTCRLLLASSFHDFMFAK
jgi:hypothetical protein